MKVYVSRDWEPEGGFYSASLDKNVLPYTDEIRVVDDFPDELWRELMAGGTILPGDDGTYDEFWFPHFDSGRTIWGR